MARHPWCPASPVGAPPPWRAGMLGHSLPPLPLAFLLPVPGGQHDPHTLGMATPLPFPVQHGHWAAHHHALEECAKPGRASATHSLQPQSCPSCHLCGCHRSVGHGLCLPAPTTVIQHPHSNMLGSSTYWDAPWGHSPSPLPSAAQLVLTHTPG